MHIYRISFYTVHQGRCCYRNAMPSRSSSVHEPCIRSILTRQFCYKIWRNKSGILVHSCLRSSTHSFEQSFHSFDFSRTRSVSNLSIWTECQDQSIRHVRSPLLGCKYVPHHCTGFRTFPHSSSGFCKTFVTVGMNECSFARSLIKKKKKKKISRSLKTSVCWWRRNKTFGWSAKRVYVQKTCNAGARYRVPAVGCAHKDKDSWVLHIVTRQLAQPRTNASVRPSWIRIGRCQDL